MRIIVEHPDTGQRVAVDEADYDNADANPLNHPHQNYHVAVSVGTVAIHTEPGRTGADYQSLKAEGFRPVARVDAQGRETPITEGD